MYLMFIHGSKSNFSMLLCDIRPRGNSFSCTNGAALVGPITQKVLRRFVWTNFIVGLWLTPLRSRLPLLTTIGSSNFGYRSSERDVECQLVILTRDPALRYLFAKVRDVYLSFYNLRLEPGIIVQSCHDAVGSELNSGTAVRFSSPKMASVCRASSADNVLSRRPYTNID
jgi:hypothetical protein